MTATKKNMGFSADLDLKGAGSSLSVNGGSNEWWNLIPVKHPHTGTIHGTGSALRENLPYSIKPGTITEIK